MLRLQLRQVGAVLRDLLLGHAAHGHAEQVAVAAVLLRQLVLGLKVVFDLGPRPVAQLQLAFQLQRQELDDGAVLDDGRSQLRQAVRLALGIQLQTHGQEGVDDGLGALIALNLAVAVKGVHVVQPDAAAQLEGLLRLLVGQPRRQRNLKVDDHVRAATGEVQYRAALLQLRQVLLEAVGPVTGRQLADAQRVAGPHPVALGDEEIVAGARHAATPAAVVRRGRPVVVRRALQPRPDVLDDILRVEARDARAEARANALGAVDEQHGDDRRIILRLDRRAVVVQVVQHGEVGVREERARDRRQVREDVTGRGMVAAVKPRAELAVGHKEVHVVGAYKVLRHVDDGAAQTGLAVVVARVLADVARELRDLDLVLQVALEGGKEDLALADLEAVHDVGDAALQVVGAEMNQVLVNEVVVRQVAALLVQHGARVVLEQPVLAAVDALLAERQVQRRVAAGRPRELHRVECLEVLLRLRLDARAETLVVLDLPAGRRLLRLLPALVVEERVEALGDATLAGLDNGCDHVCHEAGHAQQVRPEPMEEVHQQATDVAAVVVLVGHDHDAAVAQRAGVLVDLACLQAENLLELLDLLVGVRITRRLDIDDLAPQRVDAEVGALLLTQAADDHALGAVALR